MNDFFDQFSRDSVFNYALNLLGQTLRARKGVKDIPQKYLNQAVGTRTKGSFGGVLEKYYFGIEPGNEACPDFKEIGVELKSHPIKKVRDGFSAKERLILGMIDYNKLVKEKFRSSKFYFKNQDILLISYLHEKNKLFVDYRIKLVEFLKYENFSEEDKSIILDDWRKIQTKVKQGKAHELSEGDTMYLGAATKSAKSSNRTSQPYGPKAKPRAFSYKSGFMTYKIREFLKIQADTSQLGYTKETNLTFDEFIYRKLKPYIGWSISDLYKRHSKGLKVNSKGINRLLIQRVLGSTKKTIPEFEKAEVTLRVIRLNKKGRPKEDISLPAFKFRDLVSESDWEKSSLYQRLNKRFLFVFFKETEDGEFLLDDYRFWTMPTIDLNKAEAVWRQTINVLNSGNIVSEVKINKKGDEITYNNFPSSKDTDTIHVRPHARNKQDTYKLPVPDLKTGVTSFTKQCFWFNKDYISKNVYKK